MKHSKEYLEATENKHTPGPYYTMPTAGDHNQAHVISEANGATVALVYNAKEDAALLAAAPELRDALRKLEDYARLVSADICDQDTGWFYQFEGAIDTARLELDNLDNAPPHANGGQVS